MLGADLTLRWPRRRALSPAGCEPAPERLEPLRGFGPFPLGGVPGGCAVRKMIVTWISHGQSGRVTVNYVACLIQETEEQGRIGSFGRRNRYFQTPRRVSCSMCESPVAF